MLEEMDTFDGAYTTDDEASGLASVNLGRSAFSLNLSIYTYYNEAAPNLCFLYSKSISTERTYVHSSIPMSLAPNACSVVRLVSP